MEQNGNRPPHLDGQFRFEPIVHDLPNTLIANSTYPLPHLGPPLHRHRVSSRSCTECGRRKVRCDHTLPCTNCIRAGSACVFPTARRPPTRPKHAKSRNDEVLRYLRRLEEKLEAKEKEEQETAAAAATVSRAGESSRGAPQAPFDHATVASQRIDDAVHKSEESGQLILDQDRSRYIGNSFWKAMAREIEEMRDILDYPSSEPETEDPRNLPETGHPSDDVPGGHDSFILGPSITAQALKSFHPEPPHLLAMFDIFQDNVDPVVRVFHRPTLRSIVQDAFSQHRDLDRSTEVVLFSLYYAAMTSISDDECLRTFQEDRGTLLARYRFATEQALARARFLHTPSFAVLSALVLFLFCVRRHDNSLFVANLLGVVVRIAQSMGLHRDGENFQLTPFQIEMRRRVWWQICVLDIRASEDHGSDPMIFSHAYDTKFPLNINDDDISPGDHMPPPAREGTTDMTFCMLRFEVVVVLRQLVYRPPGASFESTVTAETRHHMVEALEKNFHEKYIRYCDITKPLEWVSATWAQLMLAKLWLAVHAVNTPLDFKGSDNNGWIAVEKSIEVLEISDLLETATRAARWGWMFQTHVQWQTVVFVLGFLCTYPHDTLSKRAWLVIDRVYERWSTLIQARQGMLWKPVRQLMRKANQARSTVSPAHQPKPGQEPTVVGDDRLSMSPDDSSQGSFSKLAPERNTLSGLHALNRAGGSPNDLSYVSDLPEASSVWAGWDHVVQGFHMGYSAEQAIPNPDIHEGMQNYMRSIWATL